MSDSGVLNPPAMPDWTPPVAASDPTWVTAEQVAAMTADYPRVEIWYGELRVKMSSRPSKDHGEVQAEFTRVIANYVKAAKIGRTFNESGVLLRSEPDVLFGPDVAVYFGDRGDGHPTFYLGSPDFVVEVRSPSNTQRSIAEKIDIYFRFGCQMVVVADVVDRSLAVHQPDAEPLTLGLADTLTGGDVLPGFSVKVADLFAD
ncbi:MAG: Uma2 family endonuclease [Planctomycetota bacterium]